MITEINMESIIVSLRRLEQRIDIIDIEKLDRIYDMKDLIKIFRVKRPETVYSRIKELGLIPLETRRLQITGRELRRKNLI